MSSDIGKTDGSGNVVGRNSRMSMHFRSLTPAIFELDVWILSSMFSAAQQLLRDAITVLETQLVEEITTAVNKGWRKQDCPALSKSRRDPAPNSYTGSQIPKM